MATEPLEVRRAPRTRGSSSLASSMVASASPSPSSSPSSASSSPLSSSSSSSSPSSSSPSSPSSPSSSSSSSSAAELEKHRDDLGARRTVDRLKLCACDTSRADNGVAPVGVVPSASKEAKHVATASSISAACMCRRM